MGTTMEQPIISPSPWTHCRWSECGLTGDEVLDAQGRKVAGGLTEADARLIAAAPNLYQAVIWAMLKLDGNPDVAHVRDVLMSALMKAEGK